jgi:histidinol-phosphate aminotransferase
MAAATASLSAKSLVAERRKLNREVRSEVFDFLRRLGVGFVPSESNCFMLDARRPAGEFVAAMARERVFVGRVWPAWPNHSRITVGTREEMEKFKAALQKVMR